MVAEATSLEFPKIFSGITTVAIFFETVGFRQSTIEQLLANQYKKAKNKTP
jgi:N-acetylglutamate synthase-like GNAT family acetyltransferase